MTTTIKKTRLTLDLSQPEMAKLMGMGRSRIVDIETGTTGRKETKVHIAFLKALFVLNANGLIEELFDVKVEEYKAKVDKHWRPIEIAPKEGIKIICASIRNGQICWVSSGMWSDQWERFWDGVEPAGFNNLTHWMPMPGIPQNNSVFSYGHGFN